jgi:hypothetical protein
MIIAFPSPFGLLTTNDPRRSWASSLTRPMGFQPVGSSTIGFWMLAGCFAFFAFRSFCWLLYR